MSKKKPVMSHDPLAELAGEAMGEVVMVPETAPEAEPAETPAAAGGADEVLQLPEALTIAEVAACQEQLLLQLQSEHEIVIDGSAVENVDGAGIQLLVAFVKDGVGAQRPLRWQGCSDRLRNAAAQMGVAHALQLEA